MPANKFKQGKKMPAKNDKCREVEVDKNTQAAIVTKNTGPKNKKSPSINKISNPSESENTTTSARKKASIPGDNNAQASGNSAVTVNKKVKNTNKKNRSATTRKLADKNTAKLNRGNSKASGLKTVDVGVLTEQKKRVSVGTETVLRVFQRPPSIEMTKIFARIRQKIGLLGPSELYCHSYRSYEKLLEDVEKFEEYLKQAPLVGPRKYNIACKLEKTIEAILDTTCNIEEKLGAIKEFDKEARNSCLSKRSYLLVGAILGSFIMAAAFAGIVGAAISYPILLPMAKIAVQQLFAVIASTISIGAVSGLFLGTFFGNRKYQKKFAAAHHGEILEDLEAIVYFYDTQRLKKEERASTESDDLMRLPG